MVMMRSMESEPRTETAGRTYPELSIVSLVRDVSTDDGVLPVGTSGTVVAAYRAGNGFEVEFDKPFHAVVTLNGADLTA